MFEIVENKIETYDLIKSTKDNVGGLVTFEGRVRDHNHGRKVSRLEYEAFKEMAILEGQKIIDEALKQFNIEDAYCVHRVGSLEIKDLAVWIVVYSEHREAAFRACEYIIDQVKTRVPIWKKEFYLDGKTDWVKCLACAAKGVSHHEHFHHHK